MSIYFKRAIGFLIPWICVGLLVIADIQPDGVLSQRMYPGIRNARMYQPLPAERIEMNKRERKYVLMQDPVYFVLRLPKTAFETVKIGMRFKSGEQGILELGPETADGSQVFDLHPIYNAQIEVLNWQKEQVEGGFRYSRQKKGDREVTATMNFRGALEYTYPDKEVDSEIRQMAIGLEGPHELLAYVNDGLLQLEVAYEAEEDPTIQIRDERGLIIRDESGENGEININLEGLETGIYTVSLMGTEARWNTLVTNMQKWVIKDTLRLAASENPRDIITNAQKITVQTRDQNALQQVEVDGIVRDIAKTYQNYTFAPEEYKGRRVINAQKGGVTITGAGVYALSEQSFFSPMPVELAAQTNIEESPVNVIYSTYERMGDNAQGWISREIEVEAGSWWEQNRPFVRMAISAPGVNKDSPVEIEYIETSFIKEPFTGIKDWLRALRERIPFGL